MKNFVAILALVAAVAANPLDLSKGLQPRLDGRIVGGNDTLIENVPYQVSLQLRGKHYCGGSLISKEWIVTAAHCVTNYVGMYQVRSGATLHNYGGTYLKAAEIIRHENYSTNSAGIPSNDIALVRMSAPISFDKTKQPITLYKENETSVVGARSVITGWGRTSSGLPVKLQAVTIPIVSKEACSKAYKQFGGLPRGQICAAYPEGGKDACNGDSGGPLNIGGRLAGIVSWGVGCGSPSYPGVYTEVASYRKWIKERIGV